MGKSERRQREKELRRSTILEAATGVFAEQGLDGASMGAIADRAEMGKASLYYYFPNKRALYEAVVAAGVERFFSELSAALPPEGSLPDLVSELLAFYLAFYRDNPQLVPLMAVWMGHHKMGVLPDTDGMPSHSPMARIVTAHHAWMHVLDAQLTDSIWADQRPVFHGFLFDIVLTLTELCVAGREREAAERVAFYTDLIRGRIEAADRPSVDSPPRKLT